MRRKDTRAPLEGETLSRRFLACLIALTALVSIASCAPVRASRSSVPRPVYPSPPASSSSQIPLPPRPSEVESKPVLEQSKITEEDIKEKRAVPPARSKDQRPLPGGVREEPRSLPDDSSLIAKINPKTSPQRAASLRLTEEGRRLLESGEYPKALARLEKTIALDSTNPYGYFYLAKAHYRLGRYQESLNFLDVAESLLASEPFWLAEVFALKGDNFRARGLPQQADSSYSQALRLNPGNRVAIEGLGSLRGETPPAPR